MDCPLCQNGSLVGKLELPLNETETFVVEPQGDVLVCDGCNAAVEVQDGKPSPVEATNVAPQVETDPANDPHFLEGVPYAQDGADPENAPTPA